MNNKKIGAAILAAAVLASMSGCAGDNTGSSDNSTSESTTNATESTTTAATTTSAATTKAEQDTDTPDTETTDTDIVKVYYGWGGYDDEAEYTADIHCPEGASFSESTLKIYEEDGSVMTAAVDDEVNEYSATSVMHWHRDAYSSEPTAYPIIAQLYFDGELDAETEADYSGCSQKVTPLGFEWNGYDVILIETTYTFKDYGEQTELFAGVEYDLNYWKVEEGTGETSDLTTKGLFGFDMYSYGWDDLTQEKCAWIAGELFGVDSGIENPFIEKEEVVVSVDSSALIGTWIDHTSDWEDTYIFNADGTGSYTSGFEYPFTYIVDANTLTVTFEEDDTEEYTVTVDGSKLVLVDKFGYEQSFEKIAITEPDIEPDTESDEESETQDETVSYATAVIGTWTESETGYNETFTFNTDGTGWYSYSSTDGSYECGFTYEFYRSDYIDIYYDDGDEGGFQIVIDGDTMTVRNEYVWDLAYTRR